MLKEEIRNIKSGKKELKQFGFLMTVVFGILFVWFWRAKDWIEPGLVIASGIFFSVTLLNAQLLKPIQKIWMILALLIGFVMAKVILSIFFYLVLTPLAFIAKISGHSFLTTRSPRGSKTTNWVPKAKDARGLERYEAQF